AGEVGSPVMPAPAPAVLGRELDFGNVLMELNALYESGMFLRGRLVHSSGRAVAYSQGIALRLDDPEVKVDDDWDPRLVDLWTNGRGEFEVFVKALTPEQLAAFEVYVCSPEIVECYSYAAGPALEARGAVRVSGTTVTGQVADL